MCTLNSDSDIHCTYKTIKGGKTNCHQCRKAGHFTENEKKRETKKDPRSDSTVMVEKGFGKGI